MVTDARLSPTKVPVVVALAACCALPAHAQWRDEGTLMHRCDAVHPAHFTDIIERRPTSIYRTPDALLQFKAEQVTANETCESVSNIGRNIGRIAVSERSEIIVSFDPNVVERFVSYLGRLDVRGQIVTGSGPPSTRPIEIPGYQEIGKAPPKSASFAAESEQVIADVISLSSNAADMFPGEFAGTERGKATSAGYELDAKFERWVALQIIPSSSELKRSFANVLNHSADIINTDERARPDQAWLLQTLQTVRTGLNAADALANYRAGLAVRVASATVAEERASLDEDLARLAATANGKNVGQAVVGLLPSGKGKEQLCGDSGGRTTPMVCPDATFDAFCEAFQTAVKNTCKAGGGSSEAETALLAVITGVRRLDQLFETRTHALSDRLKDAPMSELYEKAGKLGTRLQLDQIAHVKALETNMKLLAREYGKTVDADRSTDAPPERRAFYVLRRSISRQQMTGWREVRLQPRVIGAKAGDVIEITITYQPPDAVASVAAQPPVAPSAPAPTGSEPAPGGDSGTARPASWTVRFLVDSVGFYVRASASLSLVWSLEFNRSARNFRGAEGKLVPGLGLDLQYYQDDRTPLWAQVACYALCGAGIRLDYLDFDTSQALELGLEGHVSLLRGVLTAGIGYNLSVEPQRMAKRNWYFSIGLGVEQAFDLAKKLASSYER